MWRRLPAILATMGALLLAVRVVLDPETPLSAPWTEPDAVEALKAGLLRARVDDPGRMVVVITGVSPRGIGYYICDAWYHAGARVVFGARNEAQSREVMESIKKRNPDSEGRLEHRLLDLSSFASVRDFAATFKRNEIDILYLNAGMMSQFFVKSQDGLEVSWQVNHVSHQLLTSLLVSGGALHTIREGAEALTRPTVVAVTSSGHRIMIFESNFTRALMESHPASENVLFFNFLNAYFGAKAANILMIKHLSVTAPPPLRFIAVHPGMVATNFAQPRVSRLESLLDYYQAYIVGPATRLFWGALPLSLTASQGAAQVIYPSLYGGENDNGAYYTVGFKTLSPRNELENPVLISEFWKRTERFYGGG